VDAYAYIQLFVVAAAAAAEQCKLGDQAVGRFVVTAACPAVDCSGCHDRPALLTRRLLIY